MEVIHSTRPLPQGINWTSISGMIKGRPPKWLGREIDWINTSDPKPVFIKSFQGNDVLGDLMLLGTRYNTAEMTVLGKSLGNGYIIEYFILERQDSKWKLHRLLQQNSITFSDLDEKKDYLSSSELNDRSHLILRRQPLWEETEAVWPTIEGKPMHFVGQVLIPESDISRTLLTWNVNLYIFWTNLCERSRFKITMQEAKHQSIEEHYRMEED